MKKPTARKKRGIILPLKIILLPLRPEKEEDWQSDRMRWTRNPVYPFPGIGGLNPSSSAEENLQA